MHDHPGVMPTRYADTDGHMDVYMRMYTRTRVRMCMQTHLQTRSQQDPQEIPTNTDDVVGRGQPDETNNWMSKDTCIQTEEQTVGATHSHIYQDTKQAPWVPLFPVFDLSPRKTPKGLSKRAHGMP